MLKKDRGFFQWVQLKMGERRFRRLSPGLPYRPVKLKDQKESYSRRHFLSSFIGGVLAIIGTIPILREANFERLKYWAEKLDTTDSVTPNIVGLKNEYLLAEGHQNTPHRNVAPTNVHSNNPSRHVNVPSEVGHYNNIHPHMNSHFNSPHGNSPHVNKTTVPTD